MICSLLTPVKNEIYAITELWNAIQYQSTPPSEWIILDNGSSDGTREWLEKKKNSSRFPVRLVHLPDKSRAQIMNYGVELAQAPIIACCQAGTQIKSNWLELLLKPMLAANPPEVSAGVWHPIGVTRFAKWYGKLIEMNLQEIKPERYLPTTRSMAFTKNAWQQVEGFPDWLPTFGEDTLFAIRLHSRGFKFAYNPAAIVGWHPESTVWKALSHEKKYAEANVLMTLVHPDQRLFLRPWAAIVAGLILSIHSAYWGFTGFYLFVFVDTLRHHLKRNRLQHTFFMTMFALWILPLAKQVGAIHAAGLVRGGLTIPQNDLQAVTEYLEGI